MNINLLTNAPTEDRPVLGLKNHLLRTTLLAIATGMMLLAPTGYALAQDIGVTSTVQEFDGNADVLRDQIRPRPDQDVVNSALIFTNPTNRASAVKCVVRNHRGNVVGRGWTKIAPQGVSLLSAAALSGGLDFIGSARCKARGPMVGQVVAIGGGLTDLKVEQRYDKRANVSNYLFPLVATY